MKTQEILRFGQQIILEQADEVTKLKDKLDRNFLNTIYKISESKGKLVVVGVGKNMPIAQKMVATLNSTGTKSQFLHAGEAMHGDLGIVDEEDIVLILSKSGNTPEIKNVLPSLKKLSHYTIGMTGNKDSFLATNTDIFLDTSIDKESGPLRIAPTTSTTVQLVLCDTIAMCLKKIKDFKQEDFGKFHPGGSLGKKLAWKVQDLVDIEQRPQVDIDADIKEVIQSLSSGRFGITVVTQDGKIVGVITDGDLRRMLEKYTDLGGIKANDIATFSPKTIYKDALAHEALRLINEKKIGQLIVVDEKDQYFGIIDFHILTNEGISEN